MKLNSEGVGGVGSDYRILPLPPPETVMTNHGGVAGRLEGERMYGTVGATKFMRIEEEECNSSSSSSIGKNSDSDVDDDHEGDAQSPYHQSNRKTSNGSFDDAIQALEEALPIRREISRFYKGKSKSFTCLADVWPSSTPSIQEIAKPENAYTRKRRNRVATTLLLSKNKNRSFHLSGIGTRQISKKTKTSTLRFVSKNEDVHLDRPSMLKNQKISSMRSFSMVNLHRCGSRFIENC